MPSPASPIAVSPDDRLELERPIRAVANVDAKPLQGANAFNDALEELRARDGGGNGRCTESDSRSANRRCVILPWTWMEDSGLNAALPQAHRPPAPQHPQGLRGKPRKSQQLRTEVNVPWIVKTPRGVQQLQARTWLRKISAA